jgi:hypothetical protein
MGYKDQLLIERNLESGSDEPLVLDAEQKEILKNKARQAWEAINTLVDMAVRDTATVGVRYNTLYIAAAEINEIAKLLGGDPADDAQRKVAGMQKQLRAANAEIHRLSLAMGNGVTNEAVENGLRRCCNAVKQWWSETIVGGYTRITVGDYGKIVATFSGMLNFHGCMDLDVSDTPLKDKRTDEERIAALKEVIDLGIEDGRFAYLLDTPRTREWVAARITERFPNASIGTITIHHGRHRDGSVINDVEVYIPLTDVGEAPQEAKAKEG